MNFDVSDLYEVADDNEARILDNLRVRAGHTWECVCRWIMPADRMICENCGERRGG